MDSVQLRQTRERLGLSVKKMAKALNTSHRTYQGWEGGRPIPNIVSTAVELFELLPPITRQFWLDEHGVK